MPVSTSNGRRPHRSRRLAIVALALVLLAIPTVVSAGSFSPWGLAVAETINSPLGDGCPIESPNGRELYIASNRTGTLGGNDIWVSRRANTRSPWSEPVNLGAPVNTEFADFCPTPLGHGWLLFVSERPGPAACNPGPGKGDMYIVKQRRDGTWGTPRHLGCDADGTGPNFPGGEFGPSLFWTRHGAILYFSSNGYGTDMDIYQSRMRWNGTFAPATPVTELNTTSADFMPNVRLDGLEMVFNSNRPGSTLNAAGTPSQDVYTATRKRTSDPWSTPVNVGPNVNTAADETRSSLSGDGKRLHFGRSGDIYVSTRTRGHGHH